MLCILEVQTDMIAVDSTAQTFLGQMQNTSREPTKAKFCTDSEGFKGEGGGHAAARITMALELSWLKGKSPNVNYKLRD